MKDTSHPLSKAACGLSTFPNTLQCKTKVLGFVQIDNNNNNNNKI